MIKKTQWIELLRRIRRSRVSFIAIFIFITFGVGLYTGVKWAEPSLYKSMEADYDKLKLRDIELVCSSGLTEDAMKEIGALPEVTEIEGTYTTYEYFQYDGDLFQAKITSITNEIDLLRVNEGSLPTSDNEIAIEAVWAEEHHVTVGSKIILDQEIPFLKNKEFTVTAFVDIPSALGSLSSNNEVSPINPSPVNTLFFVNGSVFNDNIYKGYTGALIRSDSLRTMSTTEEEYKSAANHIAEEIRGTVENFCTSAAILTRESRGTIVMTSVVGGVFGKLCASFGSVFIIIGILVCYSTVSRLVYQETILIGTKKALGLYDCEVSVSFFLYAIATTVLGVIAGALLSVYVVQPLLLKVLSGPYLFSKAYITFEWKEIIILFVIELSAMCFSAFLACYKTLRKSPLTLLNGPEPPSSKANIIERTALYNKLSLFSKCFVRNFMNDKRRVIATLIGIIGCTALTVSSITFDLSVTGCTKRQFSDLQHFDTIVYFDPDKIEAQDKIAKVLSEKTDNYAKVGSERGAFVTPKGNSMIADVLVDDAGFNGLLEFYRVDGSEIELQAGVLIPCAYSNYYGIDSGDEIVFRDSSKNEYNMTVCASMEYYLQLPRIVMTAREYESYFGKQLQKNAFIVEKGDITIRELSNQLCEIDGYVYTQDYNSDLMKSQSTVALVINVIMYLYIALSVLIAIFVIFDILLMFVAEKKRELITLIINGYSVKYAHRYISVDTCFLSVIGILCGIAVGILLGNWNINNMQSDTSYFLHGINLFACIAGAAFTSLLMVIMTSVALKQVDRFELSDINKI